MREKPRSFCLYELPHSAMKQPKGSPKGTKTPIKGSYPLLTSCFPLLLLPLSRAASRKLRCKNPSTFNREQHSSPGKTSTFILESRPICRPVVNTLSFLKWLILKKGKFFWGSFNVMAKMLGNLIIPVGKMAHGQGI